MEFIVDETGRQKAVVLPIEEWRAIEARLHELADEEGVQDDIEVARGRRDEPTVPWEEVRKKAGLA